MVSKGDKNKRFLSLSLLKAFRTSFGRFELTSTA